MLETIARGRRKYEAVERIAQRLWLALVAVMALAVAALVRAVL